MKIKCITICQPYAELIMRGDKRVENRTWSTRYRGTILIHAGKSRAWFRQDDNPADFTLGAIVGRANLLACHDIDDLPGHLLGHEHAHGPICWELTRIERFARPIPMRGRQGLYDVDLNWLDAQRGDAA